MKARIVVNRHQLRDINKEYAIRNIPGSPSLTLYSRGDEVYEGDIPNYWMKMFEDLKVPIQNLETPLKPEPKEVYIDE